MDVLGEAEAVKAGGGEDQRVGCAFGPLAEAGVDVAAHLDEGEVGAQCEKHRLAARAGGGDARTGGQHVQPPGRFADEGVAGIGAWGDGGEREARVYIGREVFERVDGEVDAAGGECLFDLLDEDAGAVGGESIERSILQAIAGGADDFDLDGVAIGAKQRGDVVGLPEREIGAARANTDGEGIHRD